MCPDSDLKSFCICTFHYHMYRRKCQIFLNFRLSLTWMKSVFVQSWWFIVLVICVPFNNQLILFRRGKESIHSDLTGLNLAVHNKCQLQIRGIQCYFSQPESHFKNSRPNSEMNINENTLRLSLQNDLCKTNKHKICHRYTVGKFHVLMWNFCS